MTLTTTPPGELAQLEEEAAARLGADAGQVEADLERSADASGAPVLEPERDPIRLAIAAALPTAAAGIMVGGIFQGASPRVAAVAGGLLGVLLAYAARRVRQPVVLNAVIIGGLFAIGLLVILPTGTHNLFNVQSLAQAAAKKNAVLRPPVPFTAGWQAIVGWLMGIVGFTAVWLATVVRRPSLGLIIPLPLAALAGISVPKNQQVGSGLAVLGLFGIALGVLSSAQSVGDEDERLPLGYELRKMGKSIAVLIPVLAILYAAAQSNFLFPKPAIDPTQKPQKPHVQPLSSTPDRVLFTVKTKNPVLPFRTGTLDIYDGTDWLLAPFANTRLKDVPRDGLVDRDLTPGAEADFTIAGLTGPVMPGLPNTIGVVEQGPHIAYDGRNGTLRVAQGEVQAGLKYSLTSEALPVANDLRNDTANLPADLLPYTQIAPPPPAVVDLMGQVSHANKWDEWDQLRRFVLTNVVTTGLGTPVSVPVSRVQQILATPKAGASPFEIVAVQALLARWVGIPSRIGYGYKIDRNNPEVVGDQYQIRPKNGVAFPEVYFPAFKWLPVIGDPRLAKPTVSSNNLQQSNPNTQPSNDIAVQVFLPLIVPPSSTTLAQVRNDILGAIPVLLFLVLLYVLYPALAKARVRARRRRAAALAGPRARIALAYSEFRDYATDYGFRHDADTPLMFLERVAPDDDHQELAWLVTRTLWGDLQEQATEDMALNAEALSRRLRARLGGAQAGTLRVVAALSRLSLRHPYAPAPNVPTYAYSLVPAATGRLADA